MTIRIAVLEDDPTYRHGLATLFRHTEGFELAGSYASADALVREARRSADEGVAPRWDLVLCDIELPTMNGIEAAAALKAAHPALPVVMLTVFEEPRTILQAICAGADGYLLKRTSAKELLAGLASIASGGSPLTSEVARTVLDLLRHGDRRAPTSRPGRLELTEREQEVLRSLVRGNSYAQVAAELAISLDTVRGHIRSIYRKLQVTSAKAAVARAIREGVV